MIITTNPWAPSVDTKCKHAGVNEIFSEASPTRSNVRSKQRFIVQSPKSICINHFEKSNVCVGEKWETRTKSGSCIKRILLIFILLRRRLTKTSVSLRETKSLEELSKGWQLLLQFVKMKNEKLFNFFRWKSFGIFFFSIISC